MIFAPPSMSVTVAVAMGIIKRPLTGRAASAPGLDIILRPPRKNQERVLLLLDVGGSMDPYVRLVETLFSAASGLNHWRKLGLAPRLRRDDILDTLPLLTTPRPRPIPHRTRQQAAHPALLG